MWRGVIVQSATLTGAFICLVVAALVATNANFYLTTWEEFHTGTLPRDRLFRSGG